MAGDQTDSDELNPQNPQAAAGASGPLGQGEVEALLKAAMGGAADPKAGSARAASADAAPAATTAENDLGMASGDVEYLLQQAEMALASVNEPVKPVADLPVKPFRLQDFNGAPPSSEAATLALIREVELDVKIELGRTQMYLDDVLKLHKGSVVALDKLAGDPVDIFVNGRLIARGEVLVLNDNFCVRVAELITGETTTPKIPLAHDAPLKDERPPTRPVKAARDDNGRIALAATKTRTYRSGKDALDFCDLARGLGRRWRTAS